MKCQSRHHGRATGRKGFTLAECLIALAISAMLLTAIAVAFNASLINYEENEELFRSVNSARQALARMTSQIRTAAGVDAGQPPNRCVFLSGTDPNQLITYEFRNSTHATDPNTLILMQGGSEYLLCDNVSAATFEKTPAANGTDSKSVQISLTVQCGDTERTLSAASVVRRSLAY
jgi:prepilin-type N-terminal cleavage/methylation domain-containing protein